jgi:hypothetical protein
MNLTMMILVATLLGLVMGATLALQVPSPDLLDRRIILRQVASAVASSVLLPEVASAAAASPDLTFTAAPSGLQYADAKIGTGEPITQKGSFVSFDYVMSTTGARSGPRIYSSADKGAPYRFNLGDGTTIKGLEEAIAGGPGVEPMRPGGIRRIIIPSKLGYETLAKPIAGMQYQDCQAGKGVGPIPPVDEGTTGEYFQRFKNIYCNANRPYQPDLVMDVKLYGKR